jgi:hypothetical protein
MHDWSNEKSKQALIMVMTEWAFMVGTKEANTKEENLINVKFVITNYGDFTLGEIQNAMNWSLTDVLEVDANCYGRFAPMYIAKILNAYAIKRHSTIRMLFAKEREDRQKKEEAKKLQSMPYADRVIEKRKFLVEHMTEMLKSKKPDVAGNLIWKVLERKGVLNETLFDETSLTYSKSKIADDMAQERLIGSSKTISKVVEQTRRETDAKRYQRDNLIHRYLETIDNISSFVDGMTDQVIMGNEK